MRSTLWRQATVDDGERALRVGAADARGQREVRPETVVAAPVVQLGAHSQEPLARAELERGADGDGLGLRAAARALVLVADRVDGPRVGGVDPQPGAHRPGLECRDGDGVGPFDHAVLDRRGVVVGVAAVAALDQTAEARDGEAVVDRDGEGAVGCVDGHPEVLVAETRRGRRDRAGLRGTSCRAERRPPEPGHLARVEEHRGDRGEEEAYPHGLTGRGESDQLLAQRADVDGRRRPARSRAR